MNMKLPNTFNIIPVKDKVPQVPWREFITRQQTPEEKLEILSKEGQKGIVTGRLSGILVLDDDGGLDETKYPIPRTWTVKTPRGGNHYYFKWNENLDSKITTKTGILEKVDIRGEGGYVVFYGWERPYYLQTLAFPPQWLIDLLPNKDGSSQIVNNNLLNQNKSNFQELWNNVHIGNRDDSLYRLASSLRGRGYSYSDIMCVLIPKAREVEFDLKELEIKVKSACKHEPNIQIDESQALSIDDFLKDQEKVDWIVPGLIAKRSIGFVVGLPETGKTWMMIDLAIEVARGGKWLGKMPVEKAKVLFIDQERFKGETQRRFKAVISAKELHLSTLKNLYIRCGTTIRIDLQHSFDAFKKEVAELKPDLIIVDSFVTFHTREENNRKDIQEVLERVKELRNEFGCTFLFIHHENKNAFDKEAGEPSISQMAGSIAIPAVAETVLTVRKHDADSSMVYHTKSTLSSTVPPFLVKVIDVNPEKTKIKVEGY